MNVEIRIWKNIIIDENFLKDRNLKWNICVKFIKKKFCKMNVGWNVKKINLNLNFLICGYIFGGILCFVFYGELLLL